MTMANVLATALRDAQVAAYAQRSLHLRDGQVVREERLDLH